MTDVNEGASDGTAPAGAAGRPGLLEDRVAVVTGSGRGIGRAIVLRFVQEGARVVINDVDEAPAEAVRAECEAIRPESAVVSIGSVADPKYTDALMKCAVDSFGHLDILVNNAGITRDRMCHKMSDEEWQLVIDVNLKGTFNCIRSAAPYMRDVAKEEIARHGDVTRVRKIVNFYSTAAIRGNPGQINYTAAKMGNVGITRTVAQEWGRFKICVNAVAPGFTETRLTAPKGEGDVLGVPEAQRQATLKKIPFGRFATPEDIAGAVLFFASPLSDFVTGQELNVSGGMQIP
ncbi:MAG: 3-oxoacyl-ACP reductase FabG [Deltaproteobacteria bacterium]|nr:MAG: 3-oxoacyl-ACP reductase FabG [Deltaproteobacteria bacterium]